MRYFYSILVIAMIAIAAPVQAQGELKKGKACPANASDASRDIWAGGSIRAGQMRTGTHPCGRRMECSAGDERRGSRRCRWL